ncbi:MAG TPA: NUDIX domain-containing protein [Nevskiaceae bacterium]|nr:NUDIX domain-containing protein [Nevskiaceae bacterium]
MVKTISTLVVNGENKILALKRSRKANQHHGKWDIISGRIKNGETPNECFERELFEKIGLTRYLFVEKKAPFVYQEKGLKKLVYPYLCKISHSRIELNHLYQQFKWVTFNEFFQLDYIPALKTYLEIFNQFIALLLAFQSKQIAS